MADMCFLPDLWSNTRQQSCPGEGKRGTNKRPLTTSQERSFGSSVSSFLVLFLFLLLKIGRKRRTKKDLADDSSWISNLFLFQIPWNPKKSLTAREMKRKKAPPARRSFPTNTAGVPLPSSFRDLTVVSFLLLFLTLNKRKEKSRLEDPLEIDDWKSRSETPARYLSF